jgi:hypothetical protein
MYLPEMPKKVLPDSSLLSSSTGIVPGILENGEGIMASFTIILAFSTIFLWVATRDLVGGAEETAKRQLRAYIGVRSVGCSDWVGTFTFASITIVNAGQTPAHDVVFWANISIDDFPLKSAEIPRGPIDLGKAPLGPGAPIETNPRFTNPVTDAQATALKAGTSAIYVKGQASYIDAFNEPRVTEFIYVSGGGQPVGSGMRPYREGNKAT